MHQPRTLIAAVEKARIIECNVAKGLSRNLAREVHPILVLLRVDMNKDLV